MYIVIQDTYLDVNEQFWYNKFWQLNEFKWCKIHNLATKI